MYCLEQFNRRTVGHFSESYIVFLLVSASGNHIRYRTEYTGFGSIHPRNIYIYIYISICILIHIWVVNQHLSLLFLINKSTHLIMRYNMERRPFTCYHPTQQLSVRIHIIYLERKGGWAVNLRAKQILSKRFPDIHWLTQIEHSLKISIGFLLKYSARFVPGSDVINIQI